MPLKSKQAVYIAAGVAVTAGIGYLIYFDQKRRNDPAFRKQLKKERKKLAKKEKVEKEQAEKSIKELIDQVLSLANEEDLPSSPEEKEKYFMAQVAQGETLCQQGVDYYQAAVLPFYLALKVYPAPLELIMIYQKTIPEAVFQILVTIMAKEQNNRVNAFYEQFPGPDSGLTLGELPVGKNDEGKTIIRRGLVADKDFAEGDVLFSESPLVSALFPSLEGINCHNCLKLVDEDNKTACDECDFVTYCSKECQEEAKGYHKYLCGKNVKVDKKQEPEDQQTEQENSVDEKVAIFKKYAREHNQMYPLMIAEFLSAMVTEETERTKRGDDSKTFTSWDHVDRFRYLDTQPTAATAQEIQLLKELLDPKVQGISEFLSDQIYLMLKGKLLYNAYAIEIADKPLDIPVSEEHTRATSSGKHSVGAGLYKLATYIGQSTDEANTKVVFQNNNHQLSVVATKTIAKGDEIKTTYTLPVAVPEAGEKETPSTSASTEEEKAASSSSSSSAAAAPVASLDQEKQEQAEIKAAEVEEDEPVEAEKPEDGSLEMKAETVAE